MQITICPVSKLKGYENNARTHSDSQINQIVESIKQFGFNDPIEIASDMTVISGHARLSAAIRAGFTEVPVVTHSHLNKIQQRAYNLAANKIAQNAEWDDEKLAEELRFLQLETDMDFNALGFSEDELKKMFDEETPQEITNKDFEPQLQVVVECICETEQNQVFQMLKQKGYKCRILSI